MLSTKGAMLVLCITGLGNSPGTQVRGRARARERKRLGRRARSRARLLPEIFRDVTPQMFSRYQHSPVSVVRVGPVVGILAITHNNA